MWYFHTLQYYSTFKMNELLIHVTSWINLKNIVFSERSQIPKIVLYNSVDKESLEGMYL